MLCRRSTRSPRSFPSVGDVCACEGSFVCSKCAGTPFDPRYEEDAPEPLTADDFDRLTEPERTGEWI